MGDEGCAEVALGALRKHEAQVAAVELVTLASAAGEPNPLVALTQDGRP